MKHILCRQHCLCIDDNYLKDLKSLNRDLVGLHSNNDSQKKTVIIDNSFYAFAYQLDNGIPISSWFDNKKDQELQTMIPLLQTIRTKRDVRPFLRSKYKLREKVNQFTLPFSRVSNKNKR